MTNSLPSSINLKVISLRKLLVDEEVQEISLPSLEGYIGILPGHRPLILALGEGDITYRLAGKEEHLSVRGGFAEVLPEKVLVFTESIEDETQQPAEG
ncbi:MAG: F0F1 ATP synthase subunit epsilon [Candidatus Aminicenantes bacterium]|nr:MAG: F0F1 ATP synthase subunit epsilon [Candidatus Aminicenantes bacterium]